VNSLLTYFLGSFTATIAGLMFYMTIENLHPSADRENRRKQVAMSALLSVLFTPLGAWLVSAVIRMRKLPPLS
jgi:zinc transporter ZupT